MIKIRMGKKEAKENQWNSVFFEIINKIYKSVNTFIKDKRK